MIKSYEIKHLNCAVCAGKIETDLKKNPSVVNATYSLANGKLIIETKDAQTLKPAAIQQVLDRHEPGAKVVDTVQVPKPFNFKLFRLVLSLCLFILGLVITNDWILLSAYFLVGYPVFIKCFRNIFSRDFFDENTLMVVASLGAIYINELVEAVAVMLFYSLGEYFQDLAVDRSRDHIQDLLDMDLEYAQVLVSDQIESRRVEEVNVGDVLMVKRGEKIPVDGIVLKGSSLIDSSALTGESMPQEIEVDSPVLAGTINQLAPITMKATRPYEDSSIAKMKKVLDETSLHRAEPEKFITKFSKVYTPIVFAAALLISFLGPILFPSIPNSDWVYRALVFLVAACPCALVLSVPLSYFAGIGKASKSNILVKGGQVLDDLVFVKKAVFDKTGTLSQGQFEVARVEGDQPAEILRMAASLEQYSSHPMAQAIHRANAQPLLPIENPQEQAGRGIQGEYGDQILHLGSARYLEQHEIQILQETWQGSVMHLASNHQYLGTIELKDPLRVSSKEAIQQLNQAGIETFILSGDTQNTVDDMAEQLNLTQALGGLLPEDKVAKLAQLKASLKPNEKLLFVGDGINDALGLQQVDIGVAMGHKGADISIEVADMILMKDDLKQLLEGIAIAQKTRRIVIQNITFALVTKVIVLTLGAFGLVPMLLAVFADVGVTLLAVLNSLRILR